MLASPRSMRRWLIEQQQARLAGEREADL